MKKILLNAFCDNWNMESFCRILKTGSGKIEGNDLKKNKNRFFTSKSRCEKSIFVVINGCYCL